MMLKSMRERELRQIRCSAATRATCTRTCSTTSSPCSCRRARPGAGRHADPAVERRTVARHGRQRAACVRADAAAARSARCRVQRRISSAGSVPHAEQRRASSASIPTRSSRRPRSKPAGAVPCLQRAAAISYNLFGIKAGVSWTGATVQRADARVRRRRSVRKVERLPRLRLAGDSFRDYAALIRDNPRYARRRDTGDDVEAFATRCSRAATPPTRTTRTSSPPSPPKCALRIAACRSSSTRPRRSTYAAASR